jgi:protein TonB
MKQERAGNEVPWKERMTLPGASRPDPASIADRPELDAFLGKAFEEKPLWFGLFENVRDSFFPPQLPPLELTSTPIPVVDRMAIKTNPWAVGTSTIVNGGILAVALLTGVRAFVYQDPKPNPHGNVDLSDFKLFTPPDALSAKGGGGSGNSSPTDPNMGRLPKREENPITLSQVPLLASPRLPVDSAIAVPLDIKLPDNPTMPLIGVRQSAVVTLVSSGPGTGGGPGTGSGGGDGPGRGNGYGPGSVRGFGGGPYVPGKGGVSLPVAIVTPEAEFSDEARREKYQGVCLISIIVDAQGNPQNPRILRRLGMGLDEKALDAVRKYRFKPAMKGGKPVPVVMAVEVNFRLY